MFSLNPLIILCVVVMGMTCLLARAWHWSEARWAALMALALLVLGQIAPRQALHAAIQGLDVYLFLGGMMLAAELARRTGVFDTVAVWAVQRARGSAFRLFCWVYGVGTLVTMVMSNDATAVVLTPAVIAAVRAARLRHALPHLYACALIANAASFVLPISNPANLVVFGANMPSLLNWLAVFTLPSAFAIFATFYALFLHQKPALQETIEHSPEFKPLTSQGRRAVAGITVFAGVLVLCSAQGWRLGWPSAVAGLLALTMVYGKNVRAAGRTLSGLSWGVMPMVAGLFIVVGALENAGTTARLAHIMTAAMQWSPTLSAWLAGMASGLVSNGVNNLPAGLFSGAVLGQVHAPLAMQASVLIGIDLGPNLSVSGSLATLLWLAALRREGIQVSAWQFLKMGLVTLPVPLAGTLAVVALQHLLL